MVRLVAAGGLLSVVLVAGWLMRLILSVVDE